MKTNGNVLLFLNLALLNLSHICFGFHSYARAPMKIKFLFIWKQGVIFIDLKMNEGLIVLDGKM